MMTELPDRGWVGDSLLQFCSNATLGWPRGCVLTTRREILTFLRQFKQAVASGRWQIVQRRVAYAQMTELSPIAIKHVLLALTVADYVSGPAADRDRAGEVLWIFHRSDGDRPYFYIKLKVIAGDAKVISFHRTRFQ